MFGQAFECSCDVCDPVDVPGHATPEEQLTSIRERHARADVRRAYCPRCYELLGRAKAVTDAVGYEHFVQPCARCLALWVVM